jgi:hypothetical protein
VTAQAKPFLHIAVEVGGRTSAFHFIVSLEGSRLSLDAQKKSLSLCQKPKGERERERERESSGQMFTIETLSTFRKTQHKP